MTAKAPKEREKMSTTWEEESVSEISSENEPRPGERPAASRFPRSNVHSGRRHQTLTCSPSASFIQHRWMETRCRSQTHSFGWQFKKKKKFSVEFWHFRPDDADGWAILWIRLPKTNKWRDVMEVAGTFVIISSGAKSTDWRLSASFFFFFLPRNSRTNVGAAGPEGTLSLGRTSPMAPFLCFFFA